MGFRLRWVGDGTGRLRVRDLWALVNSLIGDETSALFRARNPGYIPPSSRYQMDTVNALVLLNHNIRRIAGDKSARKFSAPYVWPGSMWETPPPVEILGASQRLGGYKRMTTDETVAWLRSRGLPTPSLPRSPQPAPSQWLDKLPPQQLDDDQLVDRIDRLE